MYDIKPSPGKGLGVFATQAISRNDKIVHEPALLSQTNAEELEKGSRFKCLVDKFDQLDDNKKAEYLSLSNRIVGFDQETYDEIRRFIHTTQPSLTDDDYQEVFKESIQILGISNANCAHMIDLDDREGFGIFPIYSRINHSCVPNARWEYNCRTDEMEVHAVRHIADNEEITITYFPFLENLSTFEERESNCIRRGFHCDCEACLDPNPDARDIRRMRMCELTLFLADYQEVAFVREVNLNIPPGMPAAIRLALELVELLEAEGLFGQDLAYAYGYLSNFSSALERRDEMERFGLQADLNYPGTYP